MVRKERKTSIVHVGNQPCNLSFSGCGFLSIYHIGVASCIKEHAPTFLKNLDRIYGCSAGSIIGAMLLNDICFGEACKSTLDIVRDMRSRYFGPLNPGFRINQILTDGFRKNLPIDAHLRTSGKLFISLTRVSDMKNVIVSEFSSRDELINALLCSCFVPFYSGFLPPKVKGVYYVDGGLSNNLPADPNTITVSPWSGSSDICPKDHDGESLLDISIANTSIQMTMKNMYRISAILFPPQEDSLNEFCNQGFKDALEYLIEHGLLESAQRTSLSLPNLKLGEASNSGQSTSRKWRPSLSGVEFYLEETEWQDEELTGDDMNDSGMSDTSSGIGEGCAPDMGIFTGDMVSLDSNHNQAKEDQQSDNICIVEHSLMKSIPSMTVLRMLPIVENILILDFCLPLVVADQFYDSHLPSTSSCTKPVSKLIQYYAKMLCERLPLDKSYTLACLLLDHITAIPANLRWTVSYIETFLLKIHSYFCLRGADLLYKLRRTSETFGADMKILSGEFCIMITFILHKMVQNGGIQSILSPAYDSSLKGKLGLLALPKMLLS